MENELSAYQAHREGERQVYPSDTKDFGEVMWALLRNSGLPEEKQNELARLARLYYTEKIRRIASPEVYPSRDMLGTGYPVPLDSAHIMKDYMPWIMERRRKEMQINPPPEPVPGAKIYPKPSPSRLNI